MNNKNITSAVASNNSTASSIYFGYFYDSLGSTTDFTDETKNLGNIHWIYSDADTVIYVPDPKNSSQYITVAGPNAWPALSTNPSSAEIIKKYENFNINCNSLNGWSQKLNKAKINNNKVVIDIQRILFYTSGQTLLPILVPDYIIRFEKLLSCLNPHASNIVSFNIFDEPYYNNSLAGYPISSKTVSNNLSKAALLVKKHFSQSKTMISLAFPDLDPTDTKLYVVNQLNTDELIPTAIDWYGLDCYFKEGSRCSEQFIFTSMEYLSKIRKPHQGLVLFPDATHPDASLKKSVTTEVQNLLIKRNDYWFQMTKNLPVVAYFPFIYSEVKYMPLVADHLKKFFNCTQKMGCVLDNLPISNISKADVNFIPETGFLKIHSGAYQSIGKGQLCGYTSLKHMESCGTDPNLYTNKLTVDLFYFPTKTSNLGVCQCGTEVNSAIIYKGLNGTAYKKSLDNSYCSYNSMDHLISCGENETSYYTALPLNKTITEESNIPLCRCGNQVIKSGFFKYKSGAYFSDGMGSFCGYTTIAHMKSCGLSVDYATHPETYSLPNSMSYVGVCSCGN